MVIIYLEVAKLIALKSSILKINLLIFSRKRAVARSHYNINIISYYFILLMDTYTFNLKLSTEPITDEHFQQLCTLNPELRLETNSEGELIIMSPTGSETGRRNSDLNYQFQARNRQYKLGVVFDSSTGFTLPNGAKRSPDVSWIAIER